MKRSRQHLVVLIAIQAAANQSLAADALDGLSLEDLTKTEITSVSRKSLSLIHI